MSFRKQFIFAVFLTFTILHPKSAHATYQDSILLQYLLAQMNYIQEAINKVGFAVEQYVSYVSEYVKMNAQKQAVEVKSGVIADQTKTLGSEELKDHFYLGPTVQMNGKSYRVMSVASSGCFGLKASDVVNKSREIQPVIKNQMKGARSELAESLDGKEEQFARGVAAIKKYQENSPGLFFGSNTSISTSEALVKSDMATMIANKKLFSSERSSNWELGGENSHDLYRAYTNSIAGVIDKSLLQNVAVSTQQFDSDISVSNVLGMTSVLANDYSLTLANNVKMEKGRKAQLVENAYGLLNVKLEQLKKQRDIEKLYIVMAHQALVQMHKEISKIR